MMLASKNSEAQRGTGLTCKTQGEFLVGTMKTYKPGHYAQHQLVNLRHNGYILWQWLRSYNSIHLESINICRCVTNDEYAADWLRKPKDEDVIQKQRLVFSHNHVPYNRH